MIYLPGELGQPRAGLLAASALMLDYVPTAAVGISAGVGALVSAIPGLQPHPLAIWLSMPLIVTVVNLRGVRRSRRYVLRELESIRGCTRPCRWASPAQFVVLDSPYRLVLTPILNYLLQMEKENPSRQIAVLLPEMAKRHWYHYFLHGQRAEILRTWLLIKGNQRVVLVNVPWHLHAVISGGILAQTVTIADVCTMTLGLKPNRFHESRSLDFMSPAL